MAEIDLPYKQPPTHPINRAAASEPATVLSAVSLTAAAPTQTSGQIKLDRYNQVVLHFDPTIATAGHEIRIRLLWSRQVDGDPTLSEYDYETVEEPLGDGKFALRKHSIFLIDADEEDREFIAPVHSKWLRIEATLRNAADAAPAGGSSATLSVFVRGRNN